MSFYKIELFGHIVYSPELSYHDLLAREEAVKSMVQEVLEKAEASFIHFEPLSDALRFQCLLPEEREDAFHRICDDFAPHVTKDLDARLLIVDKDLDTLYFYSLTNGRWQEAVMGLPPAGHLEDAPPVQVARIPTDHPKTKADTPKAKPNATRKKKK